MDIVLSVTDTFIFDRLYAAALPRKSLLGNLTASPIELDIVSEHFNWQPSEYAHLSQLSRDNDYRQLFSLFLITW